jgi:hypothetical protein
LDDKSFDNYFEQVLPLAVTVSIIKTRLAEQVAKQIVARVAKKERRRLTKDEIARVQLVADDILANLNLDYLGIDPTWSPKDKEQVEKFLVDLKSNSSLEKKLAQAMLAACIDPQKKIQDFSS